MGSAAKPATPALIDALADESGMVRFYAGLALGEIGAAAVPDLVVALKDKKSNVRANAALAVGSIGPTVAEVQAFNYEEPADNDSTTFSALPTAQIASIQALILRALEQPITLRLDGQSDAGIVINAGGIIVIIDATIDAGATTNATVNNPDATEDSQLKGLAGGT